MGFLRLLLLSAFMFVGTYAVGFLPLSLPLSQRRIKQISLLGTGLLIGAALTIIIPEGIDALYRGVGVGGADEGQGEGEVHEHVEEANAQGKWIGLALISGFILMFLVHQFTSAHGAAPPRKRSISAINKRNPRINLQSRSVSASALPLFHEASEEDATISEDSSDRTLPRLNSSSPLMRRHTTHDTECSSPCEGNPDHLSTTVGLVVHSLADGISLGASSFSAASSTAANLSASRSLEIIIFIAIMVHKAPAAFGLTSILLQSSAKAAIRQSLLAFSLAAPIGALTTYALLALVGDNSEDAQEGVEGNPLVWWTGMALLFSGGTFLFVATHVMNDTNSGTENDQDHSNSTRDKIKNSVIVVAGMCLPLLLQYIVGHRH